MNSQITIAQRFSAEMIQAQKRCTDGAETTVIERIYEAQEIHHELNRYTIDIFTDGSGLFDESIVLTAEQVAEFKTLIAACDDLDDEEICEQHDPHMQLEDFFYELRRLFTDRTQ